MEKKWDLKVLPIHDCADDVGKFSTFLLTVRTELQCRVKTAAAVCVLPRGCQALPGLIKWSAALLIVTAEWVLSAAMSCEAMMPKSGLSWWMGSLSPSNYRWIVRCIHYLCWLGLCACVCPGVSVTPAELQGVSLCVLGRGWGGLCSRGFCFSSAVGSVQYSWALWGSVCCVALKLALPLKLSPLLHHIQSPAAVCNRLHWRLWLKHTHACTRTHTIYGIVGVRIPAKGCMQ